MTIVINLGLHTGCIGSIFITGIFGNFYTKRGEFLTFRTGIPGGLGVGHSGCVTLIVIVKFVQFGELPEETLLSQLPYHTDHSISTHY